MNNSTKQFDNSSIIHFFSGLSPGEHLGTPDALLPDLDMDPQQPQQHQQKQQQLARFSELDSVLRELLEELEKEVNGDSNNTEENKEKGAKKSDVKKQTKKGSDSRGSGGFTRSDKLRLVSVINATRSKGTYICRGALLIDNMYQYVCTLYIICLYFYMHYKVLT